MNTEPHKLVQRAAQRQRVECRINHAAVRHSWLARHDDAPPGYVVLGTRWCNCGGRYEALGPHLHLDLVGGVFPLRSLLHVLTIVDPERVA